MSLSAAFWSSAKFRTCACANLMSSMSRDESAPRQSRISLSVRRSRSGPTCRSAPTSRAPRRRLSLAYIREKAPPRRAHLCVRVVLVGLRDRVLQPPGMSSSCPSGPRASWPRHLRMGLSRILHTNATGRSPPMPPAAERVHGAGTQRRARELAADDPFREATASISATMSRPVAIPISAQSSASSSVAMLPARRAARRRGSRRGRPPRRRNGGTPRRRPSQAEAMPRPARVVQMQGYLRVRPALADGAHRRRYARRRRPAHGIGQAIRSIVTPASAAMAMPSATVRATSDGAISPE